jgi:hypothetical protein
MSISHKNRGPSDAHDIIRDLDFACLINSALMCTLSSPMTPSVNSFLALLCVFATTGVFSHQLHDDDPHCAPGMHAVFVQNAAQFDAPLHKFTKITESFFDDSWYGVRNISRPSVDEYSAL